MDQSRMGKRSFLITDILSGPRTPQRNSCPENGIKTEPIVAKPGRVECPMTLTPDLAPHGVCKKARVTVLPQQQRRQGARRDFALRQCDTSERQFHQIGGLLGDNSECFDRPTCSSTGCKSTRLPLHLIAQLSALGGSNSECASATGITRSTLEGHTHAATSAIHRSSKPSSSINHNLRKRLITTIFHDILVDEIR